MQIVENETFPYYKNSSTLLNQGKMQNELKNLQDVLNLIVDEQQADSNNYSWKELKKILIKRDFSYQEKPQFGGSSFQINGIISFWIGDRQ